MTGIEVMAGFRAECEQLATAMFTVDEAGLRRPTPCPPWTVAELLAHVTKAVGRTVDMLAAPEPATADTDAVGYYRPELFHPDADAERIRSAQRAAADALRAGASSRTPAEAFDTTWRRVDEAVRNARADRRVVTRHGDRMTLTDFMVTRVAEVVLHGLDLSSALGREPWTTDEGAVVVEHLLLTAEGSRGRPKLGWDRPVFLAKATGREPLTPAESERATELGVTWIALG